MFGQKLNKYEYFQIQMMKHVFIDNIYLLIT